MGKELRDTIKDITHRHLKKFKSQVFGQNLKLMMQSTMTYFLMQLILIATSKKFHIMIVSLRFVIQN